MKDLTKQRQDSVSDKVSPRYKQSRCNTGYALNQAVEALPTTSTTTKCPFWIEVAKKSKIGFDDCYPHPPREPSSPVSLYNYDGEYPPDQQRDDEDTEKSVVLPYVINVWDVARSTIFLDEDDMTYLRDGTRDLSSCFRWNTVKERRTAQVVTTTTTKQRIRPSSIVLPSPRTTELYNSNNNNNNNNNKESTRDRPYYLEPALGSSRKGTVVPSLQKGEAFSFDGYGNDDEDTSSMENTPSGDQKKLGPHQGSF